MLSLAGMLYTAVIKVIYRRNNWIGLFLFFFLTKLAGHISEAI